MINLPSLPALVYLLTLLQVANHFGSVFKWSFSIFADQSMYDVNVVILFVRKLVDTTCSHIFYYNSASSHSQHFDLYLIHMQV